MVNVDGSVFQSVIDQCASIFIEDESEGGLVVEENEVVVVKETFKLCLVGRFLTDKSIRFVSMQNTLAALWRPIKGVCIRDLGAQIYLFQFFHELEL